VCVVPLRHSDRCNSTTDTIKGHADCGPFGGWPYLAYQYILNAGGLDSEANVPYCAGDGACVSLHSPYRDLHISTSLVNLALSSF
jgi:hypothetical protein